MIDNTRHLRPFDTWVCHIVMLDKPTQYSAGLLDLYIHDPKNNEHCKCDGKYILTDTYAAVRLKLDNMTRAEQTKEFGSYHRFCFKKG